MIAKATGQKLVGLTGKEDDCSVEKKLTFSTGSKSSIQFNRNYDYFSAKTGMETRIVLVRAERSKKKPSEVGPLFR